jgi:predicted DNA-binding transcriptional regulator YafY
MEPAARLLRLLSLLQTARDWPGAVLAERLGVDVRTVRRDVDKLRGLGYPVHATSGIAGYRLGAGTTLPPLQFDDDDAVAIAIGLRTAATGGVTGVEESSLRALAKLEQVLPARLRHRVAGLHSATVSLPRTGPAVDPDVLTAIASACRDCHRIRFEYRGHDGASSVRRVEPHRVVHTGRWWYLVGWDVDRADWRTYRVDRIAADAAATAWTGPRFPPREPPDGDVAAYLSRGITTRVYRYRVRILLHAPAATAAAVISPSIGVVEAADERTCVLHTGSNSLDEVAGYVGMFGFRFRVLDPPELVERVRVLGERLAEAAASSEPAPHA